MPNYFFNLPEEIRAFIYDIIKREAAITIQKNWRNQEKIKEDLIPKLILDLIIRNNCLKFNNPLTSFLNIRREKDIDTISPTDKFTYIVLNKIDKLINGNEFFGKNAIFCPLEWNKFLWIISMGIWEYEYESNFGQIYYNLVENLYHSLRTKTARGAILNEGISEFNKAPPLFERIPISELD